MTDNNIGAGEAYTLVQTWENDTNVTSGWKGIIVDSTNFDETLTISGGTGTPDATNYVWLEPDTSNRHAGVAGTGHARIDNTTSDTQAVLVQSDFVRIGFLEIKRSGANIGSSDEGLRFGNAVTDFLGESLYVWTTETDADTDGFYTADTGSAATTIRLVNTIIEGWQRAGFHIQVTSSSPARDISVWMDWCSVYGCGASGEGESGAFNAQFSGSGHSGSLTTRNSAFMDTASTFDDISATGSSAEANFTLVATNCITSDASQTARDVDVPDVITGALESVTSSNVWTDAANGDFSLVASGDADGAGASISGSPADSRADYTVDIAGVTRTQDDIGAFTLAAAGGGPTARHFLLLGVGS